MSIRRIVAGSLVFFCLGLNVLALVYVKREHRLIEKTIQTITVEDGHVWTRLCGKLLRTGDKAGLDDTLSDIARGAIVQLAMVVNANGHVIGNRSRPGADECGCRLIVEVGSDGVA